MSVKNDLDRRLASLPHGATPSSIQMTEDDAARLVQEISPLYMDTSTSGRSAYCGIPIKFIEHGGPHIHYTVHGRTGTSSPA